jgi:hypothetical protein
MSQMTPDEEHSLDEQYPELRDLGMSEDPTARYIRRRFAILGGFALVLLLVAALFVLFVVIPCNRGAVLCP